jgi:hypothetical protein
MRLPCGLISGTAEHSIDEQLTADFRMNGALEVTGIF